MPNKHGKNRTKQLPQKQNRFYQNPTPDRLIRLPEVEHLTGYSKSSVYRLMLTDQFPRPVKMGQRAVAWRESSIQTWIANRVTA